LLNGRARAARVDYRGIALLALSLGLLQIVFDRGQRASEPILDLRIFKERVFDLAAVLEVSMSFLSFGTILLDPLLLHF
jgi:hypothetical protein